MSDKRKPSILRELLRLAAAMVVMGTGGNWVVQALASGSPIIALLLAAVALGLLACLYPQMADKPERDEQ